MIVEASAQVAVMQTVNCDWEKGEMCEIGFIDM